MTRPRVLRLADLTPAQRELVRALLAQKKAAPVIVSPGAAKEARRHDRDELPPAA